MANNKLSWMIGGKAGYGIMVTGMIFSKACARGGLNVFDSIEYPSIIRGGHNTYHVRVEEDEIYSHVELIDVLVALNKETVDRHKDKITKGGVIIYDSSETKIEDDETKQDIMLYDVPLVKIAKANGNKLMINTVALGATFALISYDFKILERTIKDVFNEKGEGLIKKNIKAAKDGYDHLLANYQNNFKTKLSKVGKSKVLLTGNEAIAIGAIKAGCKLYAAYPMTPASSILHYIAAHEKEMNIVVKQTEDEIAAIHTIIGASFAGVRAMTATSGGGFCLMSEGLGLAAITETPIVIALCQRPGPSTGIATKTEQADLRFVMHASQGEFTRIIATPGDVDECFSLTASAFNLAEKYQIPVFIISDKHLSESHKTTKKSRFEIDYKVDRGQISENNDEEGNFKRFKITKTGVSPRAFPGNEKTIFRTSSYERDEYGWNSENPENRKSLVDKRSRKESFISKEIPDPKIYGPKKADISIISWGSTKGAVIEAMKFLENENIKVNFMHFNFILPFKTNFARKFIESSKNTLIVEQNHDLQLAGILSQYTGLCPSHSLAKYDGRQVLPHEIYDRVKEVLK